jgi:hypothetical protein
MSDTTPKLGCAPFILGKTREDIIAAVDEPDKIEETDDADIGKEELWWYQAQQVDLTFSEEYDWRLVGIGFSGKQYTINGVSFIGAHERDLPVLAASAGIGELELIDDADDDDDDGKCFVNDEHALMFWLADGIVENFSIMLPYDANDTPIWPA